MTLRAKFSKEAASYDEWLEEFSEKLRAQDPPVKEALVETIADSISADLSNPDWLMNLSEGLHALAVERGLKDDMFADQAFFRVANKLRKKLLSGTQLSAIERTWLSDVLDGRYYHVIEQRNSKKNLRRLPDTSLS